MPVHALKEYLESNYLNVQERFDIAMSHAMSIGADSIWELKSSHGNAFSHICSQAEAWIAKSDVKGPQCLDLLKKCADADLDRYYGSILVLKEGVECYEFAHSSAEEHVEFSMTLALSGEAVKISNICKTDRIHDIKQQLKLERPLSKGQCYTIVQETSILHDNAIVQDVLRNGKELQAIAGSSGLLDEATLETLFKQGVTCERTEALRTIEEKLWNVETRCVPLPSEARSIALKFMQRGSLESWYRMVALFDIYCLRCQTSVLIENVPSLCAAILGLVTKFDDQLASIDCAILEGLPELTDRLSQHCHMSTQTLTNYQSVEHFEMDVIEAVSWQFSFPSVFTWCNLFVTRYSILTRRMLDTSLAEVWKHISAQMEYFVLHSHVSDLGPRQVSVGLVMLGFVSANLVSVSMLFPDETDKARAMFLSDQQDGAATLTYVVCSHDSSILELLETTTCASIAAVRSDCRSVAIAIQQS